MGGLLGVWGGQDGSGPGQDVEAEVAACFGPFVVLLGQHGADQADQEDDMHFEGMPQLHPLMIEFLDNGGVIWACGACTKPRGITEEHLVQGASIIGAAKVVEEIAAGAQNIIFA